MIKRPLMAFGLGVALLGGVSAATAAHAARHVAAHPMGAPAISSTGGTGAQTADAATGANDQTQVGDQTGPDTAPASNDGETTATAPDGDNVQAGDQSGPDTPDQSGQ